MNRTNNRKSQFTKKLLANTLIKLLDLFPYNEITILQICQYAEVARASFYRNFNSKDEVLEYHIQSIIDQKIPDPLHASRMFLNADESIAVWYNEKELFKKLYENDLFWLFTKKLNDVINQAFSFRKNDSSDPFYDYMATEMAYIISAIFYKWTERGFIENKAEMAILLERLHHSRSKRELHPKI